MPKAPLLPDDEIRRALEDLDGWTRAGDALERRYRFRDFAEAVAFIAGIVPLCDEQNHHPDVVLHWNELTLRLWTHASGGITVRDLRLARALDALSR